MSQQPRFKHKSEESRSQKSPSKSHFYEDQENSSQGRKKSFGSTPRNNQFSREGSSNESREYSRKPFTNGGSKDRFNKENRDFSYSRKPFSSTESNSTESRPFNRGESRDYKRNDSFGQQPRPYSPRPEGSFSRSEGGESRGSSFGESRRSSSSFGESRGSSYGESRSSSYGESRGSSFGKPRGGRPSFGRGGAGSKPKRVFQKFNPSMFIKKVTEQAATTVYNAVHTFQDFAVSDQIKANISAKGYVTPTPIQDQAIPLILAGNDVIGTANTGTGKTAAFLIPLIDNVLSKKVSRVLIVTATRELALQIKSELDSFKLKTPLASVICIGGCNIYMQIQSLKRDPAFVICTPGRLRDLESNGHIQLARYDAIVLDEVDTMLDIGFIGDITYVVSKLPEKRQSLFFSATITEKLRPIMNTFLRNPITVSVKTRESAENVNQDVIKVTRENKIETLHELLIKPEFTRVIIFSRTKHSTDKLAETLQERGFEVATIHGNKSQGQRQRALAQFKNVYNKVNILLATDLMARGIDINDVSHVINYDMPETYEDYIHKIGRTGRGNKVGNAITFID